MNFISSITLQFRDAFSSGFSGTQNSLAGMKGALDGMNQNKAMFDLAADLSLVSGRFEQLNAKVSAMIDEPSKLAGTFETSMKNIQAITGSSAAEIEELSGKRLPSGENQRRGRKRWRTPSMM